MPVTTDPILRAPAQRVEPKVFISPDVGDLQSLNRLVGELRSLVREGKDVRKDLGAQNQRGRMLAHTLTPFLRRHAELVEQHAAVLKAIDERATEAAELYSLIRERADRLDRFEAALDERERRLAEMLTTIDARLAEAGSAVGRVEGELDAHLKTTCDRVNERLDDVRSQMTRLEEQADKALRRIHREFDGRLIAASDDANSRLDATSERIEKLVRSSEIASAKLRDSLTDVINRGRSQLQSLQDQTEARTRRDPPAG